MMKKNKFLLAISFFSIFSSNLFAQVVFYSLPLVHDLGYPNITSKGLGSAGAIVSNCNDASAVFYNPGALAFNNKISVNTSGSFSMRISDIEPKVNPIYTSGIYGLNSTSNTVSIAFNSFNLAAPITKKLTIGFSFHNNFNPVRFSEEHNFEYEIDDPYNYANYPSQNQGSQLLNISNSSNAKTFALGYAFNDNMGIGISYGKVENKIERNYILNLVNGTSSETYYKSSSSINQWSLGYNYRGDDWFSFGLKYTLPTFENFVQSKLILNGTSIEVNDNIPPTLRPYIIDVGVSFGDPDPDEKKLLLNFSSIAIAPQLILNSSNNFITFSPLGSIGDTSSNVGLIRALNYTQNRLGIAYNSQYFRMGYNAKSLINTNFQQDINAFFYSKPPRSVWTHSVCLGSTIELDYNGNFLLDLGLEANFFNFSNVYRMEDQIYYNGATNSVNERFYLNYTGVQVTFLASLSWAIDAEYVKD